MDYSFQGHEAQDWESYDISFRNTQDLSSFFPLPLSLFFCFLFLIEAYISAHFDDCFEFLNKAKESKQAAVVCCMAGVSRSPTVVCAYLMKEQGLTALQALNFVSERRRTILPNQGFISRLLLFEQKIPNLFF